MRISSLTALLAVGAILTVSPQKGEACSIAPATAGILSQIIPVDGVLPISLNCSTTEALCSNPASAFEVFDAVGNVVPGTLVESIPGPANSRRVTMAWAPASGWTSGARYQFHSLTGMGTTTPLPFSVVPSVLADQVTISPALNATYDYGEGVKCGTAETTCGTMQQYFYPDVAQVAELSLTLDASSTWSAQSVLSVQGTTPSEVLTTNEVGLAPGDLDWSIFLTNRLESIVFKQQAAEYCYRVLSRKLGQSSVTVVAADCLPHGALPTLRPLDDPKEFGFDRCTGPTPGDEGLWCEWARETALCSEANRAAFADQCAEYDRVCPVGLVQPTPNPAATGNTTSGSGCQFSAVGCTRSGWRQLLFGLTVFTLARRRARADRTGR
jgi:hypothetical protein